MFVQEFARPATLEVERLMVHRAWWVGPLFGVVIGTARLARVVLGRLPVPLDLGGVPNSWKARVLELTRAAG